MDTKELLIEDDCREVLSNYLKRSSKLISYTLEPLSSTTEGLLGEHFKLNVRYELENEIKDITFFMKTLNGNSKILLELSKTLNAYEKEEFFYTVLCKKYQTYRIDLSFAPKAYLCKPYFIVLEDLKSADFKPTSKVKPLDVDHCKVSLTTLAKFHAAGIAYEYHMSNETDTKYSLQENYPTLFDEKLFTQEDNAVSRWFKHSIEGIFCLIDHMPENGVTPQQFKEKLQSVLEEIISQAANPEPVFSTILHGDVWSNNFLYKYEDGVPVTSKLVDYQLFRYGPPSLDVDLFILSNTRKNFRDEHFRELVTYYYKTLSNCLEQKNVTLVGLLTLDEFLGVCEEVKVMAKLQATVDRCITFVFDELSENITSDEDLAKFVFEDRSKHILNSFKNNNSFREIIQEDLLELKSIIFSN